MGRECYEESLELALAAQRQPNAGNLAYLHEVVALAHLDRIEEARQAFECVHAIKPDFDLNFIFRALHQARAASRELYIVALKKLGLEE